MSPLEVIAAAHVAATLAVGGLHAWLIVLGLRAMRRASDSRDRALAAQEQAAGQRHAQAMAAQEQRHVEAMRRLDMQERSLETLIGGLETLIERSTPAAAGQERRDRAL